MPALGEDQCRTQFAGAAVAVLGTHGPAGRIDLVPVTFVVKGGVVVHGVDHKAKSTRRLQRLDNVERDPRVSLLVDHYDEDWSALWWVRAVGRAEVTNTVEAETVTALAEKYGPYRAQPPAGPFVRVTVDRWTGWSAT